MHQQCYPAFVEMESSECESTDDTDAEQLAIAHCTSAQQSGGGSAPPTAKTNRLAAELLRKRRHRAEETCIHIHSKISNRTQSLALLCLLTLADRQSCLLVILRYALDYIFTMLQTFQ